MCVEWEFRTKYVLGRRLRVALRTGWKQAKSQCPDLLSSWAWISGAQKRGRVRPAGWGRLILRGALIQGSIARIGQMLRFSGGGGKRGRGQVSTEKMTLSLAGKAGTVVGLFNGLEGDHSAYSQVFLPPHISNVHYYTVKYFKILFVCIYTFIYLICTSLDIKIGTLSCFFSRSIPVFVNGERKRELLPAF